MKNINKLTDKELIEALQEAYGLTQLTKLADAIDIPYPTLSRWDQNGEIKDRGTAKQYLRSLLREKEKDKKIEELKSEVKIIDDFSALLTKRANN